MSNRSGRGVFIPLLIWLLWLLAELGFVGLIFYVIYHFITKYW